MENKIDFKIPEEVASEVLQHIADAASLLKPYLIALNPEERRTIPKVNDGTSPFVLKTLEFSKTNPQFMPPYVDLNGFSDDMDSWMKLNSMLMPVQQFANDLADTTMQAGSESYVAALSYYNSVKQAAKMSIPGSKPIYDELKQRFANNGSRVTPVPGE